MSTDIHEKGDATLTRFCGTCSACHVRRVIYQLTTSDGFVQLCDACLFEMGREAQKDRIESYGG